MYTTYQTKICDGTNSDDTRTNNNKSNRIDGLLATMVLQLSLLLAKDQGDTHTDMQAPTHTDTDTHAHTHAYTHTHTHSHTHTHTHSLSLPSSLSSTHAHALTVSLPHTDADTDTDTDTDTLAHTNTLSHTYPGLCAEIITGIKMQRLFSSVRKIGVAATNTDKNILSDKSTLNRDHQPLQPVSPSK